MVTCIILFFISKGHSDRHDHSDPHGFHRASQKTDQVQKSGPVAGAKIALRDPVELKDYIMKNSVADLTAEQLQHILNIVETTCNGQGPSEDHKTRGKGRRVVFFFFFTMHIVEFWCCLSASCCDASAWSSTKPTSTLAYAWTKNCCTSNTWLKQRPRLQQGSRPSRRGLSEHIITCCPFKAHPQKLACSPEDQK